MQTEDLTSAEFSNITRALEQHLQERGNTILGAQLGLLVSGAIRPRKLSDIGGLRRVASESLKDQLSQIVPTVGSHDITYRIERKSSAPGANVPPPAEAARAVTGIELWRFFSNPKLACALMARPSGEVLVLGEGRDAVPGTAPVQRPTQEEYRTLAQQFADQQEGDLRDSLQACLSETDFYNGWIAKLREKRTSSQNLLRQWETVRAEHIAKRLYEALAAAGIEDSTVASIVAGARPAVRSKPARPTASVSIALDAVSTSGSVANAPDRDIEEMALRTLVHRAVDQMSLAELREFRVPASLLHDAVRLGQR